MASFAFLFLLFLSIQLNSSLANINPGSSLTTNDNSAWLSPSQDFAFGFRQAPNSSLFLLAIWFNKIPERTIIWHAIGDNSINPAVPAGSRVALTASNLVLTDPKGSIIWKAEAGTTISSAAMLDTGNFVLAGVDPSYLWESFQHPTDTILPNQTLNLGDMLFSRLTATNYTKGRYRLNFTNGNLQLNPVGWPSEYLYNPYYNSNSANMSESGNQLVFNESGNIYIVKMNGDTVQLPEWDSVPTGADNYYRASLDFDGVFTQYAHPKDSSVNQIWSSVRFVPRNICVTDLNDFGSGACGYNSYCSVENSKPSCQCPPRYVFADPQNKFGGCIPTFPQGCGQDDGSRAPEELYEFITAESIDWPLNDYERLESYNQSQCQGSCLHDCSCAVAISRDNTCWKKRLPLSNGRTEPKNAIALFKVRKEVPPSGCSGNQVPPVPPKSDMSAILGAFLGCSAFLNLLLLVLAPLILVKVNKRRLQNDVQDPKILETNLRSFAYEELEEATDCFREELGRGSFGVVYKGVLKSGSRNVIAVKKLDKLAQEREKEFTTEVSAIGKTHHKNLVRLLGYCIEGSNRLLIYEFMSNGTLASFLFTHPRPDWHKRVRVALGIARGLLYLHEDCNAPIIHCDIKPQNILLDDYLNARISDFGLAKLLLSDQSRTRTMIRGTRGYVAPEWFKNVRVTTKVDVYSFGVLLLEIICCRKSVQMELEEEERAILTDWAYDCYVERRIDLLVDNDEVAMSDAGRLQSWVMIAFWCIQEDPSKRPTMKMVMEMLEGFVEVPSPTCPFSSSNAGNSSYW